MEADEWKLAKDEALEDDYDEETTTTTEATTTTEDPFGVQLSPISCKDGIINSLEDLLNYVASGWKYHVSNTDGVRQAWLKLDNATTRICSHMTDAHLSEIIIEPSHNSNDLAHKFLI
ncbi:unnamed protein product [Caenorhabditis bovis]|uniref:Uncharacterized protein n=1 Tax=Caenorhabditis bovis TaxID=2654633 RepID=A0A8S1EX82_9PELO|nr:unnamed protein product [Caenorhabditis bovis]